ncbi:MAG: restriction endonuclease subunit S [Clostridium sp.]|nr:restriction endonuclease subunit S [Clostridium sp.]
MARGKKKEELSLEEKLEQALVPVEEQPYEVPGNWCWVYASSIFDIEYGKGLPTKNLIDYGYPVFGANGQIGYYSEYMFEDEKALMSCRGAYSGIMNLSLPKSYVTSNSLIIEDKGKFMMPKYICCLFEALDTTRLISGSAQPQVTVQAFNKYAVPLPPLYEQQRIVERIEGLFAKLDEVREKVQDAKDNMATRKKTILCRAFSGELTKGWRKSHSAKREAWNEVQLIDVLKEKPRNGYSPKPVDYETPYKSMTLSATTSGVFRSEYFKFIDEHIEENSYLWLKPGDILIQRANSLEKVGTSAIYNGGEHEFIYPDLMMKLQVIDSVSSEFIAYQLKTERVMNYIRSNATGTAGNMPKINQKVVSAIPIVLPSREEQIEIVRILDLINIKEFQICTLQEKVLEKIEAMRKSILKKAFCGELGTNNPEEQSAMEILKTIFMELND